MFQCNCPPDDCAGLVESYLEGKREAGDVLVHKFTPLVMSIVQRVLGPARREEWEDACQTIFLRVFANLDKWEHRCPFCKWLAVVVARRAIDLSRVNVPSPQSIPIEEIADPRQGCSLNPDVMEHINQIVARYPTDWRKVWDSWLQGRSREETAREVGKSLRTIQYWLAEMLDQVRESLSGEEE